MQPVLRREGWQGPSIVIVAGSRAVRSTKGQRSPRRGPCSRPGRRTPASTPGSGDAYPTARLAGIQAGRAPPALARRTPTVRHSARRRSRSRRTQAQGPPSTRAFWILRLAHRMTKVRPRRSAEEWVGQDGEPARARYRYTGSGTRSTPKASFTAACTSAARARMSDADAPPRLVMASTCFVERAAGPGRPCPLCRPAW